MMEGTKTDSADFRKDPKLLYNYLNDEINHIINEGKKPGWTKWAIFGAMAGLLWLSIKLINENAIQINNLSLYILILFYGEKAVVSSKILLNSIDVQDYSVSYALTNDIHRTNRNIYILQLFSQIIQIFLIQNLSQDIPIYFKIFLYSNVCIYLYFLLSGIILSFLKRPMTLSSQNNKTNTFLLIFLLIIHLYFIIFLLNYTIVEAQIHNPTMQLSIIIVGMFELLLLLNSEKITSRILPVLLSIRRQLILSDATVEEIIEQTKLAIFGLRIIDVFQNYLAEYAQLNESIRFHFDKAANYQQIIYDTLNKSEALSESDNSILVALQGSIGEEMTMIMKITEAIIKVQHEIGKRIRFVRSTAAKGDIEILRNIIGEEFRKNMEKNELFERRNSEIRELISQRFNH